MKHASHLAWGANSVSLAIAGAFVLLSFLACLWAWRRAGYDRAVGGLELLRFVILVLLGTLLLQPEWTEEFRPEGRPTVAVLWDDSASMRTRDVLVPASKEGTAAGRQSRQEASASLHGETTWERASSRLDVVREAFSSEEEGARTNLDRPLSDAFERFSNLRAVVLISDGDWNDGRPPVESAAKLKLSGVKLFAVPMGSTSRLPDIELLSVDTPTFAVRGKPVRIPFTIESTLPREQVTTVTLESSRGEVVTQEVRIAANSRTTGAVLYQPKESGDETLTLRVPPLGEEDRVDNNAKTTPIAVRDEKLRVLVVESAPRWEYRYLRNALSRDPGVSLSCLLFHPGLSKPGGGNKDYIKEFPKQLDQLTEYDVVFLGDVGVEKGQLTDEDCRLLKGLVEHQASGLVFLPGKEGRQTSLLESELKDLYPVVLDASMPAGWGARQPCSLELTDLGRRSLLTKLADTEDDNSGVWDGLPGFQWYAPVVRAKVGVDVLCVHRDVSNEFGRLPLLATRTFGTGKILFMGTDGAWRWRRGVEDKYHYRFWGQVVRWMAYQRNMAKGETMRLYYTPEQPTLRQTMTFRVNAMEKSGEPLSQGTVTARIVAPSGKGEDVRFESLGDEWGAFAGTFVPKEPGSHAMTLFCRETKSEVNASFLVQGSVVEATGRAARPEVLEELARVTGGAVVPLAEADRLVELVTSLPEPPARTKRTPLWAHPVFAGGLVLLLALFWTLRKVAGLV